MENSQNNDNQNITGLTSQASLPAEPMPREMQTRQNSPVPVANEHSVPKQDPLGDMSDSHEPNQVETTPMPNESDVQVKPVNKTIMGGVDPEKSEVKGGIGNFMPSANEITSSRNKYAMMGLAVGLLLLVLALGGYYFLTMYSQPVETPVETPTETVTEQPALPPLEEDLYIQNINQLEATSSETDVTDLGEKLQMLDFEGIDPQAQ